MQPSLKTNLELGQFIWRDLTTNNRPVSVYRGLIDVVGSLKTAVLLSQMIYWTRFGRDIEIHGGWFFKNSEQFAFETGLSRKELLTARAWLNKNKIVEIAQHGHNRVNWYRINFKVLNAKLIQHFDIDMVISDNEYGNAGLGRLLQNLGRALPYHTILAKVTGSVNSGLMLSMLMHNYFKNKNQKISGYITKHIEQWTVETGLSYKEQKLARSILCPRTEQNINGLNIISERHLRMSREIYTSINFNVLYDLFAKEILLRAENSVKYDSKLKACTVEQNRVSYTSKRDQLPIEKGPTHSPERSNTIVPKGEIPLSQKVKYHDAERLNTIVPKGQIVNIEKITGSKSTNKDYISRPQPQKNTIETHCKTKQLQSVSEVVVVSDELLETEIQKHFWPYCFNTDELRLMALDRLKFCKTDAQIILDEIAGNEANGKVINKPLRYLSTLIQIDIAGQFFPDVAHHVRSQREKSGGKKSEFITQAESSEIRNVLPRNEQKRRLDEILKTMKHR